MLLAIGLSLLALGAHGNVAPCEKAMIGHGPAGWRGESVAVTVSVPPDLRGRVFLYYGSMRDRDGQPTTSFVNNRGYDETEFQLCGNKPRTIWPGGLRVRGTGTVRLNVEVAGRERPYVLHLGRPHEYRPPTAR